jgi:predicted alpha/beta-hydrolase family hydrolase
VPAHPDYLIDGDSRAPTIILAHGAGATMDSPFMNYFTAGLAAHNFCVVRFEFPYMRARRTDGKKPGPNRAPVLIESWHRVIEKFGPAADLIIGGKSMGGRIASLIADDSGVRGLVCLGYPFHPAGKPEKTRTEHLAGLKTPTLILQGTRDRLGSPDDVAGYRLSKKIDVQWMEAGDHSFTPTKKSGRTEAQNWDEGVAVVKKFADGLP